MNSRSPLTDWAARVVDECQSAFGDDLVAVWLHGSHALGGATAASDLDVLVVVRDGWVGDLTQLSTELLRVPRLELSVIEERLALTPEPPWPYLLHVNSADQVAGGGADDPDVGMHLVVCRAAAVTLAGVDASVTIGEVERSWTIAYLADELRWGLANADARYAVLNACRARAFAEQGLVLSKVSGAEWFLNRLGEQSTVKAALAAQRAGRDLGPADQTVEEFVLAQLRSLS